MTILGEARFTALRYADKIVIDRRFLNDPVVHRFYLSVSNYSTTTLYYKLLMNMPYWKFGTTLPGTSEMNLGGIGANGAKTFYVYMVRPRPSNDVDAAGNLTLQVYSDSGYTNLINEASLDIHAYIMYLEGASLVQVWDFDDGTKQGWSTNLGVAPGGIMGEGYMLKYSLSCHGLGMGWNRYASKSITLPDAPLVFLSFYFYGKWGGHYGWARIDHLWIYVNGELVYYIPYDDIAPNGKWIKIGVDLSAYRGQTVTLEIKVSGYCHDSDVTIYLDHIVIAGL